MLESKWMHRQLNTKLKIWMSTNSCSNTRTTSCTARWITRPCRPIAIDWTSYICLTSLNFERIATTCRSALSWCRIITSSFQINKRFFFSYRNVLFLPCSILCTIGTTNWTWWPIRPVTPITIRYRSNLD